MEEYITPWQADFAAPQLIAGEQTGTDRPIGRVILLVILLLTLLLAGGLVQAGRTEGTGAMGGGSYSGNTHYSMVVVR